MAEGKSILMEKYLTADVVDYQLYKTREVKKGYVDGSIYGGQFIGQSINVALNTVPDDFHLYSFHGTFLSLGDNSKCLHWKVNFLRDGFATCSRQVEAYQNKGIGKNATKEIVFSAALSFCIGKDVAGTTLAHQDKMPEVEGPEKLRTSREMLDELVEKRTDLSEEKRLQLVGNSSIYIPDLFDSRPVDIRPFSGLQCDQATFRLWIKCTDKLDDEMRTHHSLLGYVSDAVMTVTVLCPHLEAREKAAGGVFSTSLDHSIWIHEPNVRIDDWLLYEMHSPKADHGRGLVHGKFWTRDGVLVASTAQEVAMKLNLKPQRAGLRKNK